MIKLIARWYIPVILAYDCIFFIHIACFLLLSNIYSTYTPEIIIYSILTKKPVRDIHELTGEQLDNLIGVFSMKSKEVDERKINMYVGRMEFDIEWKSDINN